VRKTVIPEKEQLRDDGLFFVGVISGICPSLAEGRRNKVDESGHFKKEFVILNKNHSHH
jgi:hypothetical protein